MAVTIREEFACLLSQLLQLSVDRLVGNPESTEGNETTWNSDRYIKGLKCDLLRFLDLDSIPAVSEGSCHEFGCPCHAYRRRQKCTNAPRHFDSANRTLEGFVSDTIVAVQVKG